MNKLERKAFECILRKYVPSNQLMDAISELRDINSICFDDDFYKSVKVALENKENADWVKVSDIFKNIKLNRAQTVKLSTALDLAGVERKRTSSARLVFVDIEKMKSVESLLIKK